MATDPPYHIRHAARDQHQPHSFPRHPHPTPYDGQPHSIPGAVRRPSRGEESARTAVRDPLAAGLVTQSHQQPVNFGAHHSSLNHADTAPQLYDPSVPEGEQARLTKTGRASTFSGGSSRNYRQQAQERSSTDNKQLPSSVATQVGEVFYGSERYPPSDQTEVYSDTRDPSTFGTQDHYPQLATAVRKDPQGSRRVRNTYPASSNRRVAPSEHHTVVEEVGHSYPQEQVDFRSLDSGEQPPSRNYPQYYERLDSEVITGHIDRKKQEYSFNQSATQNLVPYQAQEDPRQQQQQQQQQPQESRRQQQQQQHQLPRHQQQQLEEQRQLDRQQHREAYQVQANSHPPSLRGDIRSGGPGTSSKGHVTVQPSSAVQAMGETVSKVAGEVFQGISGNPYSIQPPKNSSTATLENERYQLDDFGIRDHENEDRSFAIDGASFQVFGVLDGHDGCKAAGFASNYMAEMFSTQSWRKIMNSTDAIPDMMRELFTAADRDFFKSVDKHVRERKRLQDRIPQGMTSYEAYQHFPSEVTRMQSLEPKIAGGCTAVLAVICNGHLFVANVGDSRVLLIRESEETGALTAEQLSQDHTIESESELARLEALGLPRAQLLRAGRLGTQENTRSIGDYYIKEGYKNVDSLRGAKSVPGLAEPYVMSPTKLDKTCRYLVLMTDGVYKSIEDGFEDHNSIESNKVLLGIIQRSLQTNQGRMENITDLVLSRIRRIHYDTYQNNAKIDLRSPLAVACRKRDDMTLTMYEIPNPENP